MSKLDKKILVTGGGSGGHVNAALSFIDNLKDKYNNTIEQIIYIGGDLPMEGEKSISIEEKLLKKTNINYEIIRAGKLQRYFNLRKIKLVFRTLLGFKDSRKILKRYKPDIVFSTGGYVTVPVCITAWVLKIPIYIHEQTTNIGLANKITAKFAKKIFVTFPNSQKFFPKKKTQHTGNLYNKNILEINKSADTYKIITQMKKQDLPIIYISGGSQGSHTINLTVKEMLSYVLHHYQIILQTGSNTIHKDFEQLEKEKVKLPKNLQNRFLPIKYIPSNDLGNIYKNMDLFIGRAGANTVYELGLLKKPSILIPIPWVTNNEQGGNAKILEELGIAKIIPEGELIPDLLFDEINKIMKKDVSYDNKKLENIFIKDATSKIFKSMDI